MLTLVPFAPAHFETLAGWFETEAEVVQWGGTALSFPVGETQLAAMLREGLSDPPARLCWMAEQGGAWVGHAQLGFDWRNGNVLLGRVAIAPSARGRGLAVSMLTAVIARAFAEPEIQRVELNVYSFNAAAIRTYQRLGFRIEGTRRASARVDAERWDTVMMAILRAEWAGRAGIGS